MLTVWVALATAAVKFSQRTVAIQRPERAWCFRAASRQCISHTVRPSIFSTQPKRLVIFLQQPLNCLGGITVQGEKEIHHG
jgi:hypothetical protein